MTNDENEKAIVCGMVRVAMYHGLPKNDWMAQVVPAVEEVFEPPLSEEIIDQIHQAFEDEMPPEMAIEKICNVEGRPPLIKQLAENLSIYAGDPAGDEKYLPQAREILKQFRAAHQRDPVDYLEIETFFHERQRGDHLRNVLSNDP